MPLQPKFEAEILECLRRSGYLLESRIVRSLADAQFFVEPNVAVKDPRTGKSREIDVLAEYFDYDPVRRNVSVKTHFVIETINNHLPLILMNPHPGSPNEDLDGYLRFGMTPDSIPGVDEISFLELKGFWGEARYSQYCALTRKKSGEELMASHSDDLYS